MKTATCIRIGIIGLTVGCSLTALGAQNFGAQYGGSWKSNFHQGITKALMSHNARDCGEYHYKESVSSANEFVVYCTRDGKNWSAYLVWPQNGDVMGPYQTSKDLPPPR